MKEEFFVYIITSIKNTVLYIGVTNDLCRRILEHKMKKGSRFTSKYNCTKLVYYEIYLNPDQAIIREKQLKNWSRKKKEELINLNNPAWKDLFCIGRR